MAYFKNLLFKGYFTEELLRLYVKTTKRSCHCYLIPCGVSLSSYKNFEISKDVALVLMSQLKKC